MKGGGGGRRHRGRAWLSELVYLETETAGIVPHEHVAVFNDAGNGLTTAVVLAGGGAAAHTRGDVLGDHHHEIRGLELLPAADGHTHQLGYIRAEPVDYEYYRRVICEEETKCGH